MLDAFQIAMEGGKHHKFLKSYLGKPPAHLERGIASIQKQIDEHKALLKDPVGAMKRLGKGDWDALHPSQQQSLLEKKWPKDIQRQMEQQEILKGLLNRY